MPFRHFFSNDAEESEVIDQFFSIGTRGLPGHHPWVPPADLFETQDGLVARFELAGCSLKGLELRVVGRSLHLRGFRQESCRKHKKAYRQMEIHYGPFERILSLPCAVQGDAAEAEYVNGMLEVYLPLGTRVVDRVTVVEIQL